MSLWHILIFAVIIGLLLLPFVGLFFGVRWLLRRRKVG